MLLQWVLLKQHRSRSTHLISRSHLPSTFSPTPVLHDYIAMSRRPASLSRPLADGARHSIYGITASKIMPISIVLVVPVASILVIPPHNIFGSQLLCKPSGEFAVFDENEPTSRTRGKPTTVEHVRKAHGFKVVIMIGDGATDLEDCGSISLRHMKGLLPQEFLSWLII